MKRLVVLVAVLVQVFASRQVSYSDYRLYRLTPRTAWALKELQKLQNRGEEVQFWTDVRTVDVPVDVLVPKYDAIKIEKFIKNYEVDAVLLNANVQDSINEENEESETSSHFRWDKYHTLNEINEWLMSLEERFPEHAKLINIGKSHEQRDILGVRLSFRPQNANRVVFIESNANAREWITSAISTYLIDQILTSSDPEMRTIIDRFDWFIVPVVNPDGFEYTKTFDRLWRKTRGPHSLICYGVDFQRNWETYWWRQDSDNPCSEIYKGPSEFSEPSVEYLARFLGKMGKNIVGYVAFNSQSSGHKKKYLENDSRMMEIRFGNKTKEGNVEIILDSNVYGGMEWVKTKFNTPILLNYHVRDRGRYGLIIPHSQIVPISKETFKSLISEVSRFDSR